MIVSRLDMTERHLVLGVDVLQDGGRAKIRGPLVERQRLSDLAHLVQGVAELQTESGGSGDLLALFQDPDGVGVAVDG